MMTRNLGARYVNREIAADMVPRAVRPLLPGRCYVLSTDLDIGCQYVTIADRFAAAIETHGRRAVRFPTANPRACLIVVR